MVKDNEDCEPTDVSELEDDVFVILSLGSNLGDSKANIRTAFRLLSESKVLSRLKMSSFYETEPVGKTEQPWFINVAISGTTNLGINNLIQLCKSIEYSIGRKSREPMAEREIDIDIIFYGNNLFESDKISIPHLRMHERKFVLIPVAEIAGGALHPKFNKSILELLDECGDLAVVRRIDYRL